MLDIKYIRKNAVALKQAIKNKNIDLNLDELFRVDDERKALQTKIDKLRTERNELAESARGAKPSEAAIDKGKKLKEELAGLEEKFRQIEDKYLDLMVKVPTIPSADTPVGRDENANIEVYKWGEIKKFSFTPKTHVELGRDLDLLDLERGAKVGGYRGYFLKNEGALLVMALMMYAFDQMVEWGYRPMIPPTLVKEFALFGTGYFKGRSYNGEVDEIYQVATSDKEADGSISRDKKFLVGTAEPSLLAYYADETLKKKDLPLKLCGYSQCYRSEIGSYGKDTKGMFRVHEFMKVEQVIIAEADVKETDRLQEEMIKNSRAILEALGLPYRQVAICTGDMSAGKYKMFDLEAWLPGMNRWGEIGSASNFLDWQARRLNVKYAAKTGEKKYVYMLNNTALASPRIFIAILENYQRPDGSVKIPKVLRKYLPGKIKVIKR